MEQALVYLADPADIQDVLPDWPDDMQLALCLLETGDCRFLMFRQEERATFPTRLPRFLGLDAADICVSPKVPGFRTRELRYSDETHLKELIKDTPRIVEEATDYSFNYAFALEEGLDPGNFLGVETSAPEAPPAPVVEDIPEPVVEDTRPARRLTLSEPQPAPEPELVETPSVASTVSVVTRTPKVSPGPNFRSARDLEADETPLQDYVVRPEQSGWIVVERNDRRGFEVRVSDPGKVFLRDDHRVVALAIEPDWHDSQVLPPRLRLRSANLPRVLRELFEDNQGPVHLEKSGGFLHLTFEEKRRLAPALPEPEIVETLAFVPKPAPKVLRAEPMQPRAKTARADSIFAAPPESGLQVLRKRIAAASALAVIAGTLGFGLTYLFQTTTTDVSEVKPTPRAEISG